MLKNLQEIMSGDVAHALVRLWSDELSEAEAATIQNRAQGDRRYQEKLHGSLNVLAGMEALTADRETRELVRDYRLLLQKRRMQQRFALGMAAGVVLAICAALAVNSPWREPGDSHPPKYFTRIDEQQTIELGDGSVVTLNTGSQLLVDYSEGARRILLERGEAFFEVADNPKRPFTVDLGVRLVTAVGTAFNIRKDPQRYQVAVIEGAVVFHEVTDETSSSAPPVSIRGPGPRRVEAGWVAEFDVSRDELTAHRPESMGRYHDWRSGMLTFFHEPLSQVVRELNRYSRRKILIEDASVMELSVVTVIRVTEMDAALRGLEHLLPIEVTRHYDRIVITASAADGNTTKTGNGNRGRTP